MTRKKALNLSVPVELLAEFDEVCRHYGHGKQKGMVLSAAMLMFLEADPAEQAECLKQIAMAGINDGMSAMIQRARAEQAQRISAREDAGGKPGAAAPSARPRKAAKAARNAVRSIGKLPTLPPIRSPEQISE